MASSVSDYNRLHGPTHQLHTEVRHVKGVATCLSCSPVSKHSQRKYCLWLYLISIKSSHSVANQDRKSQPQSSTWAVRSRSVSSNRHEPASQTFISENEALKPPVVSTITSWQLLSFRTNLQLHLSSECFCCCQNVVYIQTFIKTGWDQFTKTKCRFVWTKKHPYGEVLLLFDISGLLKKCNTWRMSQDLWTQRFQWSQTHQSTPTAPEIKIKVQNTAAHRTRNWKSNLERCAKNRLMKRITENKDITDRRRRRSSNMHSNNWYSK